MCGISVVISSSASPRLQDHHAVDTSPLLPRRGPDHCATHSVPVQGVPGRCIHLTASVLHLRGPNVCRQPVVLSSGSVLCWNGQVYHGLGVDGDLQQLNDTMLVAKRLEQLEDQVTSSRQLFAQALRDTLEELEAEFALAFYHAGFKTLFFGRDIFGRRSLLVQSSDVHFALASVDLPGDCDELKADGLYYVDATVDSFSGVESLTRTPWKSSPTALNLADTPCLPPPADPTSFPALGVLSADHQQALDNLFSLLSESVRVRVLAHPPDAPSETLVTAPVAILFSGGLDCSILAALAHVHLPPSVPIDLINVAFANPRALSAKAKSAKIVDPYAVPDRVTARNRLVELQSVYPSRHWRLLECNVPYARVEEERVHILRVMKPTDTVMDFSIALALWFAAREEGMEGEIGQPRAGPRAKIVLSGLGADEQCGGYSRHRGAFDNTLKSLMSSTTPHSATLSEPAEEHLSAAWSALGRELQVDVARIATRNLGRDDRIISDHAREVRLPFLDARVVSYLNSLPVHLKCDPRYVKGIGDKVILRMLAKHKLGLHQAAVEEKRAIQFGARSAKMEVGTGKDTGDMAVRRDMRN